MAKLDRALFSMIQYCKITVCYGGDFPKFVAFSEYMNFKNANLELFSKKKFQKRSGKMQIFYQIYVTAYFGD